MHKRLVIPILEKLDILDHIRRGRGPTCHTSIVLGSIMALAPLSDLDLDPEPDSGKGASWLLGRESWN